MKKLSLLFAVLCVATFANATTSITTPTVSGHWTLAGSPYQIHNDIKVDAYQSLVIDPGVQVKFMGPYRFEVYGSLRAKGTSTQYVNFTVNDTTGWADTTTSSGCWHGLQFQKYSGSGPDSSALEYCNISFTKFREADFTTPARICALGIGRGLSVKNCNLFKNTLPYEHSFLFTIETSGPGDIAEVSNCNIYDNYSANILFYISNILGGASKVNHNNVYQNVAPRILFGYGTVLDLNNNDLHDNTATFEGVVTIYEYYTSFVNHVTISANKVHHNTCVSTAAILCLNGKIDITGNLICNNKHTVTTGCSWVEGGGGIRCIYNDTTKPTQFNIKNNIIANNEACDVGGGIEISGGGAVIVNNHIINNKAPRAPGIYFFDEVVGLPSIIKNNIIYGNTNGDSTWSGPTLSGFINQDITYDHNATDYPLYQDVDVQMANLIADSTTNLVGVNPGMVAPTHAADVTESALTADFRLLASSACINVGSTTGITSTYYDYDYNSRISGSGIDFGAFEYGSSTFPLGVSPVTAVQTDLSVYPNPANNLITVSSTGTRGGYVTIADIAGKIVAERMVIDFPAVFDISSIQHGIYFVILNKADGEKAVQKLIVQ